MIARACIAALILSLPSASLACTMLTELESFAETRAGPDGATCATYLTTANTTGTSCHWQFAYRSADAQDFANDVWQGVQACLPGGQIQVENDVNHPDSYGLRTWQTGDKTHAVAIKDKANLNGTFVFLRVE